MTARPPDPDAADQIAAELLAAARPLRVAIARDEDERRASYRLRYEWVTAAGWASPDQFPDGLERDEYDDDATHILVWDRDRVAGTMRLVGPETDRPLPTEKAFAIEIEPRGEVLDAGRVVISATHRGDAAHRVLGALFAGLWREMHRAGHEEVVAASTERAVELYGRLGLRVEVLGSPSLVLGEDRLMPVRISPGPKVFEAARRERR